MGAGLSSTPGPKLKLKPEPDKVEAPERRAISDGLVNANSPGRRCEPTRDDAFAFALFSGVEYASKTSSPTGWPDRHRHALNMLMFACKHWVMPEEDLSFVLSLGDLTAGNVVEKQTEEDLQKALTLLEKLARYMPVYHALGNEALTKARKALLTRLGVEGTYFSRPLPGNWKLIVLDTENQCMSSSSKGSSTSRKGIGVGTIQLKWLKSELEMSEKAGERVIVASHDPILEGAASRSEYCIKDCEAVKEIILGSCAPALVLCNGEHGRDYHKEENLHFISVPPMASTPASTIVPYFIIEIDKGNISIRGFGGLPDRLLKTLPPAKFVGERRRSVA